MYCNCLCVRNKKIKIKKKYCFWLQNSFGCKKRTTASTDLSKSPPVACCLDSWKLSVGVLHYLFCKFTDEAPVASLLFGCTFLPSRPYEPSTSRVRQGPLLLCVGSGIRGASSMASPKFLACWSRFALFLGFNLPGPSCHLHDATFLHTCLFP